MNMKEGLKMNDSRELTVEFTLKPADIYSPFRWDRENLTRWVIAALFCYILYDVCTRSADTLRSFDGGTSIFAIVVLLFVFILFGLLLFPFFRMRAIFHGTPTAAIPRRVTFRADAIQFESAEAKSECKWTLFSRVVETPRVFVFAQGKAGGTYIPKRCFATKQDIALLRELIRQHFKGKTTLRRD